MLLLCDDMAQRFLPNLLPELKILFAVTGRTVYHGPRDQVVPFFEQLGFQIPERKGVADFIQEICSEKDQQVQFCVDNSLQHC